MFLGHFVMVFRKNNHKKNILFYYYDFTFLNALFSLNTDTNDKMTRNIVSKVKPMKKNDF